MVSSAEREIEKARVGVWGGSANSSNTTVDVNKRIREDKKDKAHPLLRSIEKACSK